MISLRCIKGEFEGRILSYEEDSITLGRSSICHVKIDDSACSRQHASIELRDGLYVITDLGATNGVLVNDKLTLAGPVRFKDRIRIGGHEFEFLADPSEVTNDLRLEDAVKTT